MKPNRCRPKGHMIKFVFPKSIHRMKIRIFHVYTLHKICISSKESHQLSYNLAAKKVCDRACFPSNRPGIILTTTGALDRPLVKNIMQNIIIPNLLFDPSVCLGNNRHGLKRDHMKTIGTLMILLMLSSDACSQTAGTDREKTTGKMVGGPCEGCDAVLEFGDKPL
jgi:hypothetical protein